MKSKRGLSTVVTTVMLVLITVIAVGIIAAFVVPMVRDKLEGSSSCFDLKDHATIVASDEYSCYQGNETNIMIKRGLDKFQIRGFIVSIFTGESSFRFEILNSSENPDIKMYGNEYNQALIIPNPGEARTYTFKLGNSKEAILGIIANDGKICDMGNFEISECWSD